MKYLELKKIVLCSLVSLFASQAYAHTGVRDAADEGKASYNGFTITHGCSNAAEGEPAKEAYPVLGQSALFPMGDNVVWRKADGTVISRGGDGGVLATGAKLTLGVTNYESLSSAFSANYEIVDSAGTVHALHWKNGAMNPTSNTITPFKITAPTIVNNCVKSLKVRIGVINWCDVGKNANNDRIGPYLQPKDAFGQTLRIITGVTDNGGKQRNVRGALDYTTLPKGNGDNNRADWWFGDIDGGSALYSDTDLLQKAAAPTPANPNPLPFWTTLTVNNTAADVALCKAADGVSPGTPVDVIVEPTGADFDAYLTAGNVQPFVRGLTNF